MLTVSNDLTSTPADANIGVLQGNRMFYINDYMVCYSPASWPITPYLNLQVQRGFGYVTTLKM